MLDILDLIYHSEGKKNGKKIHGNPLFGTLKFNTLRASVKVKFYGQILHEASPISIDFIKSGITLRIHLSSS